MDIATRLNMLKSRIEAAKTSRARAQAQFEAQENRKNEIEEEMRRLGVDPMQADAEIERLDREIADHLAQAEALVPADFRG